MIVVRDYSALNSSEKDWEIHHGLGDPLRSVLITEVKVRLLSVAC